MTEESYGGLLSFLFMVLVNLLGVAFLTLLERKILGFIQIRKGPNKVGFSGILQPFSDAIKLFTKELSWIYKSNYMGFYLCPMFSFGLVYTGWMLLPYLMVVFNYMFGLVFFMVCLSLSVYGVMIAGWTSNSIYSLIGGLRAVAQMISYEVSMCFIFLSLFIMIKSYSFIDFYFYQKFCWFMFILYPFMKMFFISILAETNRVPFDFAESESELVSGYNTEYGGGSFSIVFLGEYSSILFMSLFLSVIFLGNDFFDLSFIYLVCLIVFMFIWVRGSLPRLRYDKLMDLCWKSILPVCLFLMMFYFGVNKFYMV
nr:NADH dehydrogenase subunit 1 [Asiopsocus sonorensis]